MTDAVPRGEDNRHRCWWAYGSDAYQDYHDQEWGQPTKDDRWIFEKICLEGFQAGLSWLTILNKRENFRKAFANFEIDKIARFNSRSIQRLVNDAGIVRHRGKIESTINNAKRAQALRSELGSLSALMWTYEPDPKSRPKTLHKEDLMTMSKSPESIALSKDLKTRGWSFVGPTTVYAFMQAAGIVNDHLEGCASRTPCESARRDFKRPAACFPS